MKRLLATLVAALVLAPAPAEAKLGDTFLNFKRSELIRGNTLFRFEGRIGARYRFGPAARSTWGSSVFLLDTQDGIIVQQTLILPFPRNKREMKRVDGLAELFLHDAGLEKKQLEEAMGAFRFAYENGKNYETGKDPEKKPLSFEDRKNLNVFTSLQLSHVLLAIGLKPDPEATPEPKP